MYFVFVLIAFALVVFIHSCLYYFIYLFSFLIVLQACDSFIPEPERKADLPLVLPVEQVLSIPGRRQSVSICLFFSFYFLSLVFLSPFAAVLFLCSSVSFPSAVSFCLCCSSVFFCLFCVSLRPPFALMEQRNTI